MKVLFTFAGLPHYFNKVLNKLNALENREIIVIAPKESEKALGKGVYQTEEEINFKVIRLIEYKTYYRKPFFKDFKKTILEEQPDIVIFIWPYILSLVFYPCLLRVIKKNRIKIGYKDIPFQLPKFNELFKFNNIETITEDGTYISYKGIFGFIRLLFLSLVRKVYYSFIDFHANYIEEARDILPTYGVKSEKIFITYNSPDTDELLKYKEEAMRLDTLLEPNNHRIIHIGRLVKWKKVDLIINAVNVLKDKFNGIELIVIGNGPEMDNLKELTMSLGLNGNVKFLGAIYDPIKLGKYLMESTIYVLAGMGGLSINEAMLYGKPVICSIADGTEKKLVRDGFNGLIFKENDLSDLINKISLLLENKFLVHEMGVNSMNIIKNEININTVINNYQRIFKYSNEI